MDHRENVLIVPRHVLLADPVAGFRTREVATYVRAVSDFGQFRPRSEVEMDSSMKQIIPYLIVRHGDRLFLFQRSPAGGEPRLHGKFSVGVGGHINGDDVVDARDVIAAGVQRELQEELVIRGGWRARLVGVLNDDSTPVGRVHFGLVHVVEIDSPDVSVREPDMLSGRLAPLEDVLAVRTRMETWSQLILDAADPMTL
jgi:predicted NUDIX family phosphoesterase